MLLDMYPSRKKTKKREISEDSFLKEHLGIRGTLRVGSVFSEKCQDGERCWELQHLRGIEVTEKGKR